ncbi:MAG: hypothetical protein AMK70_00530 [Nitrospira bacterium SG8_35_1]|nr:MAG: hypothetical protein AMK70_00530 [Nitrospira bacterium SG8_35_1]
MKPLINIKIAVLIFIIMIVSSLPSFAWFSDPKINSHVAPIASNQIDHQAVPDGEGGAIIVWAEKMSGSVVEFDIYAQRIDHHGDPVWSSAVSICSAPDYQGSPRMISDGLGGAIITWHDSRGGYNDQFSNFDIYAQRISSDGQSIWQADGVEISTAPEYAVFPFIAPDGFGGAIIAWDDGRSGNSQDYAQRVNKDGQVMWQADGVIVADTPDGQSDVDVAADGFGGAFVVWNDYRSLQTMDTYIQRFDANGNRLWGVTGIPVAVEIEDQFNPHVISDGAGGAIIAWTDGRAGNGDYDIYAQRLDPAGDVLWATNGIPVTDSIPGGQVWNAIVEDNAGGVIIVWEDGRKENGDTDIYTQRLTADGVPLWTAGGVAVASSDEVQIRPKLHSDGAGGSFIVWQDFYRGGTSWNIYAQHVDASGLTKWKSDGVPVSTADDMQSDPLIISDGLGGSIVVWFDNRSGTYFNIYAQQVDRLGLLGGGEFKFYTADTSGQPKTVFEPGELILFKTFWTVTAPLSVGSYIAESAMVINSSTDFRSDAETYDVTNGGL